MKIIKDRLTRIGYTLVGDECAKITVKTKKYGYRGDEFASILRDRGIECEFSDPDYTVLMLSPENSDEEIGAVERVLFSIPKREEIQSKAPVFSPPFAVMSTRKAMLSPSCECEVKKAEGKVLSQPSVSCPPAIPVLVCGERIDAEAIRVFEYYGIEKCRIVIQ